tara:strand:- start:119 stop:337 length:219 start_codon:yes stop_codon:yes gene_type:complete
MNNNNCIHQDFTWNESEEIICAECGALVYLITENTDAPYFEILTKKENGVYDAFHRTFEEQLKITFRTTKIH